MLWKLCQCPTLNTHSANQMRQNNRQMSGTCVPIHLEYCVINACEMSRNCLNVAPVSYTHLDVYKRQILYSSQSHSTQQFVLKLKKINHLLSQPSVYFIFLILQTMSSSLVQLCVLSLHVQFSCVYLYPTFLCAVCINSVTSCLQPIFLNCSRTIHYWKRCLLYTSFMVKA